MALTVPILSYEQLRDRAEAFLRRYNEAGSIPIPIEEIIEFDFGINVIPLPGLQRVHEVDACISSDLKSLIVDLAVLESRSPNRYRFSLSHELAHAVLHSAVYEQLRFSSVEDWKAVMRQIPEPDRGWLEWQAYSFAGLILVPGKPLREGLDKAVRLAIESGINLQEAPDPAKGYIATWLGRHFQVSSQVIEKRLDYDKLWPPT